MSYHDALLAEISSAIDELQKEKKPLQATWIAQAICAEHAEGLADNDHQHFWRHGGYTVCRDQVRRCINKRTHPLEPKTPEQKSFAGPGFEHLQDYYLVRRDGDEIGIHRDQMTDDEIDARAKTLESMGDTCYLHADELRRFKRLRAQDAA